MSMFVSGSITSTGSFGELHALDRMIIRKCITRTITVC